MNTNKQINIMILLVFLSVFATGAYTLWDPDRSDSAEDKQLEATTERGAWLFSQNCRQCHGDEGEGGAASNRLRQAPPLNRPDLQGRTEADGPVDQARKDQAYRLVFNTITCGRVGKAMPTWGIEHGGTLNEEQIRQLTTLITEGGTGWDEAREFALDGVPAFDLHGDTANHLRLEQAIDESSTELVLNDVKALSKDLRLQFVEADENGQLVSGELMLIQEVDHEQQRVVVERGLGSTTPEAHEAGAELITPPVPPEPVATVAASCGQTAAAPQPTAAPEPPSAELEIVAQGIAWNKAQLSALAAVPLTITVDNRDAGIAHNWHLFEGAEPGGEDVAATEIENGLVVQTLNFGPLDEGDYYYVCDVHPQMEGILTASTGDGAAAAE